MDLETLVSVCGGSTNDRKITCETLADNIEEVVPPDLPPESFWLSKDAEFDWFDRNAFLERKESTKGISNSTPTTTNSTTNSQRFVSNLKSKAGIFGLPKTQKTNYVDAKRRQCKAAANTKLFPKRPDSVGKSTSVIAMVEPSSPKVSCMGRVRSKRGRRKAAAPVPESKKPELKISKSLKKTDEKTKKLGILARLTSMFGSSGQRRKSDRRSGTGRSNEIAEESVPRRSVTVNIKAREYSSQSGDVAEPPSIGAMNRFVSGRRSDAFGDEADVAHRNSIDLSRRGL